MTGLIISLCVYLYLSTSFLKAFGEFMKENRLAPSSPALLKRLEGKPSYVKALEQLEKSSRFWPMVISETILFNIINNVSPLPQLLLKETLTNDEVLKCKQVIYNVVGMESKNDPLPVPAAGARGKGPKRDEQYRQLWAELEALIRSYSDTSPQHAEVLECLQQCRSPPQSSSGEDVAAHAQIPLNRKLGQSPGFKDAGRVGGGSDAEQNWRDQLDRSNFRLQQMSEREKQDFLQGERQADAPPPKKMKSEELLMRSGGQTLLSMWNHRLRTIHSKRAHDFDGETDLDTTGKARLYIHLEENNEPEQTTTAAGGKK
ncbi:protein asunder homolog [Plakobranchus ocellatus]|uniref:Protein asunder homolog n=1 Tax=Plakobranchus ocellatus TaxID=259542 RepID=A0AAV3YAV0_9GAST|nr:protein asunder homolog [Plakobranchus ocellatus]